MNRNLKDAILNRRTYYTINKNIKTSDKEIEDAIAFAVKNVPSAFNSQSARIVLLLGGQHIKLWDIVKETLRKIVPADAFGATESKINGAFAAGYGTVLFFEDQAVVKQLQSAFPSYKENFPIWSQQTSAMHQFAIWTMLEDLGLGASLQHYNPLIDNEVIKTWNLDREWKLIAQMPFGNPTEGPGDKTFEPIDERFKIFK